MTTSAHLDASPTSVLPGEEVRIPLELRNSGNVVEAYSFEVLGPAARWSVVEPATISLYPNTAGQVELVVRPPRDTTVAPGELTYGVRVLPQEQPQHATVPEGVLHVRPYAEFAAELTPRMGTGRTGAGYRVALDNRGNYPLSVALSGKDTGDLLKFGLPSGPTLVEPGRAAFVKVPVKPKRWLWRGTPVPHAFQLHAVPAAGPEGAPEVAPVALDGSLLQRPVLSPGLLKAVLAVVALAAVLAGLWFGVLRPVVRSAAKEAVKEPVKAAQAKAEEAKKAAEDAKKAGGGDGGSDGKPGGKPGGPGSSPSPSPSPSPKKPGEGPGPQPQAALFSARLTAAAAAGGSDTATYTVPEGKVLRLTGLILENPQGDNGTVVFSVGGKPLLAPALENFREQDFHWGSGLLAAEKQEVTITLTCRTVGRPPAAPAPTKCSAAALLNGTLE
ncbi:hypothetical protein [Streptomyces sp. NRRL S-87]|uniref:COG1470 family protein n=1 Tax=Streptomyces sp. NRRL S-87 TaxID=1463920 RepID=UPI0004BFD7F2|nr:hypothetical protein [Streptomyces sp. NRRL S-87]